MESQSEMLDSLKFEKEDAIARFSRLRTLMRLRQLIEVAAVFAAFSWFTYRAPAVVRSTGASFFEFSTCLSNHHVVFLIGNAIIVLLLMLCRRSDATPAVRSDFYDDYVKYSEAARAVMPPPQQSAEVTPAAELLNDCDKRIAAARDEEATLSSQCDDAAAARQIKRYQRTQSEMLSREVSVRQGKELRRSETERDRKTVITEAADIEDLSNEEFRRRVDAFIDKHWSKTRSK